MIEDLFKLFKEMKVRDDIFWIVLIFGYVQFGKVNEVIYFFEEMFFYGFKFDEVIFVGIMLVCSRAGLVEKGKQYFELMVKEYGIVLIFDYYICMIDFFSRVGKLKEVKSFIFKMFFIFDVIGWGILLSFCRFYGNREIVKWVADFLFELDF